MGSSRDYELYECKLCGDDFPHWGGSYPNPQLCSKCVREQQQQAVMYQVQEDMKEYFKDFYYN